MKNVLSNYGLAKIYLMGGARLNIKIRSHLPVSFCVMNDVRGIQWTN